VAIEGGRGCGGVDESGHRYLIGETEGGGLSVNEDKTEGEAELGV
jgi:hypothetical protein